VQKNGKAKTERGPHHLVHLGGIGDCLHNRGCTADRFQGARADMDVAAHPRGCAASDETTLLGAANSKHPGDAHSRVSCPEDRYSRQFVRSFGLPRGGSVVDQHRFIVSCIRILVNRLPTFLARKMNEHTYAASTDRHRSVPSSFIEDMASTGKTIQRDALARPGLIPPESYFDTMTRHACALVA
jgi:hypothetical protein